jgi:signal recognition particle GTPase
LTFNKEGTLFAACDIFRVGVVDQLQQWAERADLECFLPSLFLEAQHTKNMNEVG